MSIELISEFTFTSSDARVFQNGYIKGPAVRILA